jgi:hypothetical protein
LIPSLAAFEVRVRRAVAVTSTAVVFAFAVTATAAGARNAKDARPLHAIGELARAPGAHRLLCEDFAWCGPALETGTIAVFVDGRADPFPLAVWNEYDAVIHARPGWRSIVRHYRIDALLVQRGGTLDRAARANGWSVAHDGDIRLIVAFAQQPQPRYRSVTPNDRVRIP